MSAHIEITTGPVGDWCSLDHRARTGRFADLAELWAFALIGRERTDDVVQLTFRKADEVETALHEFAAAESRCCPGFDIAQVHDEEALRWEVTLNEHASPDMLDALWTLTDPFFEAEGSSKDPMKTA